MAEETRVTIKDRATQKAGPLPVWAWGLIGAVTLYLVYRHFKKASAANVSQTDSNSGVDGMYDDDDNQPEGPHPTQVPVGGGALGTPDTQPISTSTLGHSGNGGHPIVHIPTGAIRKVGRNPHATHMQAPARPVKKRSPSPASAHGQNQPARAPEAQKKGASPNQSPFYLGNNPWSKSAHRRKKGHTSGRGVVTGGGSEVYDYGGSDERYGGPTNPTGPRPYARWGK